MAGNLSYVWCGAIDFIRLNYLLTMNAALIIPFFQKDHHILH